MWRWKRSIDASEDDAATGGPDPVRNLWPVIITVTATGADDVADAEVAAAVEAVQQERAR